VTVSAKDLSEYFAKMGKKGGKKRVQKQSAEQRKASARHAAEARWGEEKAHTEKRIRELADKARERKRPS